MQAHKLYVSPNTDILVLNPKEHLMGPLGGTTGDAEPAPFRDPMAW